MIRQDPIFKGCTRPAMLWGVPIVPMVIALGTTFLLAFWIEILLIFLAVPVVFILRMIAKQDDQQFRLLGLKAKCRLFNYNRNARFWKSSAYAPIEFKKRK